MSSTSYLKNMVHVTKKEDIPEEDHFAILTFDSIYIPGDERSRQCPGHGYPAETKRVVIYEAYTDEGAWKQRIAKLEEKKEPYFAFVPKRVNVKVHTEITFS